MGRSPSTYVLPPGTTPQVPNTVISSAVWNAAMDDIAATFNVPWPVAIGLGAAGATGSWDSINVAGTDIASSGTINLTTATGPNLTITGTTTISTVTLGAGNMRFARANAAFQLTASANLVVNGSTTTNYTTVAGDLLIFLGYSGSVTRVWAISGSVAPASLAEVLAGTVGNKYVSPATAYYGTGHLFSCFLSNNVTDANNDIDIATGTARDSTDSYNLKLASAITKRLDASWAVGTNQGGLDTGSKANSTWYAVHLIKRLDTNVVDVLFSTSATAPTLPANYTVFRQIGWIRTNSSGNIIAFTQFAGRRFIMTAPVQDVSTTATVTATLVTMTAAPSSVALIRGYLVASNANGETTTLLYGAGEGVQTPSNTGYGSLYGRGDGTRSWNAAGEFSIQTNSSSQITHDSAISGTAGTIVLNTYGWVDNLGMP